MSKPPRLGIRFVPADTPMYQWCSERAQAEGMTMPQFVRHIIRLVWRAAQGHPAPLMAAINVPNEHANSLPMETTMQPMIGTDEDDIDVWMQLMEE